MSNRLSNSDNMASRIGPVNMVSINFCSGVMRGPRWMMTNRLSIWYRASFFSERPQSSTNCVHLLLKLVEFCLCSLLWYFRYIFVFGSVRSFIVIDLQQRLFSNTETRQHSAATSPVSWLPHLARTNNIIRLFENAVFNAFANTTNGSNP